MQIKAGVSCENSRLVMEKDQTLEDVLVNLLILRLPWGVPANVVRRAGCNGYEDSHLPNSLRVTWKEKDLLPNKLKGNVYDSTDYR